ncbi:hypothetical protein BE17_02870 [Sorangium cellulosum]|uniref:Uncharacterized protein n=1 Tax=Sorangium cellulosum TaxID=56 RepID=A0A150R3M3_SORCE|nr:hypothetical protein BE17_02870 [Sorangium cellulosum]
MSASIGLRHGAACAAAPRTGLDRASMAVPGAGSDLLRQARQRTWTLDCIQDVEGRRGTSRDVEGRRGTSRASRMSNGTLST